MISTCVTYRRPDGSTGAVITSRDGYDDVAYYQSLGYAIVSVVASELCDRCGGHGQVRGRRKGPLSYRTCPACHGQGIVSQTTRTAEYLPPLA